MALLRTVTKWAVFYYGLVLIVLGTLAYFFIGSKMSVIMGGSVGFLLLLSALAMFFNKKLGAYSALVLTLLMAGFFSYRYSLTHAPVPAALAVISGAMLVFLLVQLARWHR